MALRALRWVVREGDVNELLHALGPLASRQFPERVLSKVGVSVRVCGALSTAEGLPIYVANHPLGGVDGLALLAWVLSRHGHVKAPVNSLLTAIGSLEPFAVAVCRNSPSRTLAKQLHQALRTPTPLVVFPAGATSRRQGGKLVDPSWNAAFTRHAREHQRPIVVVHVSGHNSRWFYGVASLRRALRIGLNLEMLLLPRELLRPTTNQLTLTVLPSVLPPMLHALGATPTQRADALRARCCAAVEGVE